MAEHIPVDAVAEIPDELALDDVFTALADRERRQLLVVLAQLETPEPLSALTRSLSFLAETSGSKAVGRVRARLYHVHVPKLVEAGLVKWDAGGERVELTAVGRRVAEALGG